MSEKDIIHELDKIQGLCGKVVNPMVLAKRQGRMLSIDEARQMDSLSLELIECSREISKVQLTEIVSPDLRCRAEVLINLAKNSLKLIVYSETVPARPKRNSYPRAAASQLNAYAMV